MMRTNLQQGEEADDKDNAAETTEYLSKVRRRA